MKISELFQRLSYGELSNLAVSNEGSGTLLESAYPRFIQYTNEALLRLHSRFILLEDSLLLTQVGNQTSYPLGEDVLKVLKVTDESGYSFPINDEGQPNSLFTPRPNLLQVPIPQNEVVLAIIYQARHPLLTMEDDPLEQEFTLPFTLEGPLQNYIAHLVFSHMNGQENILKSQEYEARYERVCAEIKEMDNVNQSILITTTRFELRGWR